MLASVFETMWTRPYDVWATHPHYYIKGKPRSAVGPGPRDGTDRDLGDCYAAEKRVERSRGFRHHRPKSSAMTSVHRWTSDLLLAFVWTLAAGGAVLVGGVPTPLRIALVLPFLLFWPGYAVVSALYPRKQSRWSTQKRDRWFDPIERVAVSLALSLAVVAAVGLVANFTPGGIRHQKLLVGIGGVTVAGALLAFAARLRQPADRRVDVFAIGKAAASNVTGLDHDTKMGGRGHDGTHRNLRLLFVGCLLVLATSVGFAATVPTSPAADARFTEAYFLSADDELITQSEAGRVAPGESYPITVAIENHERAPTTYTSVIRVERLASDGTVTNAREVDRAKTVLDAGETGRVESSVRPPEPGRYRLVVAIYRGPPGEVPADAEPYRTLSLRLTVGSAG